jgi:ribosomal protein S18 acetylase RimI-like enzyme
VTKCYAHNVQWPVAEISLLGMRRPKCCILTSMSARIVIRRAQSSENDSVHALVQAIADETFGYLFAPSQVPIGEANWLSAWLALSGDESLGVTMTRDEWVSDLWVRRESRRTGIGGELLAHAEREIRTRGHDTLRLRVVKSNTRAVEFYQNNGWRVQREFPHEKFGHAMFEMTKSSKIPPVS